MTNPHWIGPDEVLPTSVAQTFRVSGDPARAIEAYLAQAAASGWRLVETACSRPERISTAVLVKDFTGFTATLVLTRLCPPPPGSPAAHARDGGEAAPCAARRP